MLFRSDRTGPVDGPPTLSDVTPVQKGGKSRLFLCGSNRSLKVYTARRYPLTSFQELGQHIKQENLKLLIRIFLFYQQNPTFVGTPPISACPTVEFVKDISVFHSAKVVFCAPSNPSSIGGLYHEMIQCTPKWKTSGIMAPHQDCILLETRSDMEGTMY